jgi:YndJ-like protein
VGFSGVIVTLTAVHFHFAAFGLVGIAAMTARARPGILPWLAALGLIGGTALTAAGFILPSSVAGWIGAVLVGSSGLLEAALVGRQVRGTSGWRTAIEWLAVAALSVGMMLAITWATALVVAPGLLDIDAMVRTHGILNSLAVLALVLTAGHWGPRRVTP